MLSTRFCVIAIRFAVFLLCWSLTINPAFGWNAAGHKIIASIAFRQLSTDEQNKVVAMLKRHPRFTEDFADQMPEEVRSTDDATQFEWLFQQSAIWPDVVRGGPPARRALNRPEWHYVNLPHYLTDAARAELAGRLTINVATDPPPDATLETPHLNIVQTIRFARRVVADRTASPQDRAVLLAWIFHDVGDIHQPLHSVALFSSRLFPEGDRGGNSVKSRQSGNLHALWDQFPGRDDSYRAARNRAIELAGDQRFQQIRTDAAASLNEQDWRDESHGLAKFAAYADEVLATLRRMDEVGAAVEGIDLSEEYLKTGGRVAELRIVQAGYRLGAILKKIANE
jgi:hypothetical protein